MFINLNNLNFSSLYKEYQDELLTDSLKLMLSMPLRLLEENENIMLKTSLIPALKLSFKMGVQNLSLGMHGLKSLKRVSSFLIARKLTNHLGFILPSLSGF